jgi:Ca2+-binding EF-hand superfamily protein
MPPLRLPLLALIAAMTATGAHAASHNRDTFIREQDLDRDGKVAKDEYAKGRAAEFARMDKNGDGGLTQTEYVDDYRPRLEATLPALPADKRDEERMRQLRQAVVRFGVLDSDSSGKITTPEFDYAGWGMFMVHETNKDGFVSKADVPKPDDAAAQ